MSDTVIAQLNAAWRVTAILAKRMSGKTYRAWQIECLAGDVWESTFVTCSSEMLRWCMGRAGPITDEAAARLAALPARSDIGTEPKVPPMGKREVARRAREAAAAQLRAAAPPAADNRPATAAPPAADNRPAMAAAPRPAAARRRASVAAAFLAWRAEREEALT